MADEFDDALGDAIRARSGGAVEIRSARHAVIARATQVRRRRMAAAGGVGALAVVGALFLVPAAGDGQVAPADTPPPTPESVDMETTPPSTVDTTRRTVPSTSGVPSAVPTEPTTSGNADAPTTSLADDNPDATEPTATATPTTVAVPVPPVTTPSTSSSTSSTSSTAAPVGDAPFTQQYASTGGSITVRWDGSALTLVSVDPADGYTAEIEDQSATRVRVRFRGDDGDSRIEIRVRDGVVEPPIIS